MFIFELLDSVVKSETEFDSYMFKTSNVYIFLFKRNSKTNTNFIT